MRNKKVLSVFFVITMFVMASASSAGTIWSQQWDSTPAFSGNFDKIVIDMGVGGGQFGDPLSAFSPTFGPVTTTYNPYQVSVTSTTPLAGSPGTNNLWNINFGTPLNQALAIQLKFYDGAVLKNTDTWIYNGTGQGNNPVSSWSQGSNTAFQAASSVPEPATLALLGLGLVGIARRFRHHA